jgi:hypothetical protein
MVCASGPSSAAVPLPFAFVDDADLIHANDDPSVSNADLLVEAQAALATWEGLLLASGGALAPEKSYWYLVSVIWKNGRWTYASETDVPGDLFLSEGGVLNKRLEPHQAQEALGIQIRPDAKMDDELKYLKQKAVKWADAVRTKRLQKAEAWFCLNYTILNTLKCPLVATTFTEAQLESIMRPIFKAALRLCGIQRNMPHKLIYGTLLTRGLDIKNLFYVQLIYHLQAILSHSHRDTPTNDLLVDNMELVQLYVGSENNFLGSPLRAIRFPCP